MPSCRTQKSTARKAARRAERGREKREKCKAAGSGEDHGKGGNPMNLDVLEPPPDLVVTSEDTDETDAQNAEKLESLEYV